MEQRITLTLPEPNPLFVQWLEHWLLEAECANSHKKYSLSTALQSLKKYPLVLHSGRECRILDGFGPVICGMLDKKLSAHKEEHCIISKQAHKRSIVEVIEKARIEITKKKQKDSDDDVNRDEAKDEIEIRILNLLQKCDDLDRDINPRNIEFSEDSPYLTEPRNFKNDCFMVEANSFDVILLVDTQETAGKSNRALDATVRQLEMHKVHFEIRRLSSGDFLWIARHKISGQEYVLPYIVERKRMDDLAASIKVGRFQEQKFRLQQYIPNVIYLIENRGSNLHVGLPIQNLLQAATNTQVQNGFKVKFTNSHADSMLYLMVMTNLITEIYSSKNLRITTTDSKLRKSQPSDTEVPVYEYKAFAKISAKMRNFKIRDLFLRQLLQLRTLSLDKALAISKKYPTPISLLTAYDQCDTQFAGEQLLAAIEFGKLRKKIGPVISKCIYHFYNAQQSS